MGLVPGASQSQGGGNAYSEALERGYDSAFKVGVSGIGGIKATRQSVARYWLLTQSHAGADLG